MFAVSIGLAILAYSNLINLNKVEIIDMLCFSLIVVKPSGFCSLLRQITLLPLHLWTEAQWPSS